MIGVLVWFGLCLLSIVGAIWASLNYPPWWWALAFAGFFFLACALSLMGVAAMVERWPWWRDGKRR